MADLLLPVGGSGISSDDLTATKAYVLEGYTAITKDSNDEPIAGTMKNVSAIDPAKSIGYTSNNVYLRMTNGAHIQNASSGYPEVSVALSEFGDAGAGNVLSGKTFTSSAGLKVSGTMTNQGAKTTSLNCGGSYTIPAGYHNGSGKITVNSLASQTSATAVAGNVVKDKTLWVNGSKITGTLTAYTGSTNRKTFSPSSSSQTWKIPWGYHDGNGYITVNAASTGASSMIWGQYVSAWVESANVEHDAYPNANAAGLSANGTNGFKIQYPGKYRVCAHSFAGYRNKGDITVKKGSTTIKTGTTVNCNAHVECSISCAANDIIYVHFTAGNLYWVTVFFEG